MAKKIEVIVDVNAGSVDITSDKVLTLTEQLRLLKKEIQKVGPGAEQDLLIGKFNDINDELDKTNLKSREFLGALSTLPGPVGAFAGSLDGAVNQLRNFSSFSFKDIKTQLGGLVDDFGKIATNLGKATGITKIYTTLNNALASSFVKVGVGEAAAATGARAFAAALTATGIGALVVGLGLAVSALMEYANAAETAAEKQKELNEQQDKMAKETLDVESQSVKRQGDLLLASEKARGASSQRIYELEQQNRRLLLGAQERYYNSLSNLEGEEARKTIQTIKNTQNDIKVAEQNFKAEQLKESQAKNEKLAQQNKQKNEKIAEDNKSADEMLLNLQRENSALLIEDERKRQDKELQNQKKAEEDKVNVLQISQDKKNKILEQINTKYLAKQKDVDKKRRDDDLKAEQEFNDKVEEIRIAALNNELERAKQTRKQKYDNDLKELEADKEFIKKSETEKAEIRKNLLIALNNDIKKIDDDNTKEEQDKRLKKLDDELKFLQIKGESLMEGTKLFYENQRAILKAAEERELADTTLTEEQKTIIKEKYVNARKKLSEQEFAANAQVVSQTLDAVAKLTGAIASAYDEEAKTSKEAFEKRKKLQIATALMSAASGVIQILTQPSTLPSPFDWIVKGINAAALAVTTGVQISNIKKTQFEGGGSASGSAGASPNLGRNYEEGGLIGGRRHAQGGTMIEAEAGEAIMTRGAVTMFQPLLSAMNQMGGGTSFGNQLFIRPDAAAVSRPQEAQSPVIMKTYVVSNELTSETEKQARLKDLSTL